jgi:type VI secretion system secreted protein Hcp
VAENQSGASRREVLRGSAIGVGALVGAMGVSANSSEAAAPGYRVEMASSPTQQFYLALTGIDGPATAKGFEKQIPLHSFGFGVTGPASSGGAGVGKSVPENLAFAASTSKASPKLLLTCANGSHITRATLRGVRTTPRGAQVFLRLDLNEVNVASYTATESGGGAATDHVALAYRSLTYHVDGIVINYDFGATNP